MKVHDDHMYHGAALIQIAEHRQFTAINSLRIDKKVSRSAYKINDEIGVYLKYANKPVGRYKEYSFTFNKEHLGELSTIKKINRKLFLALVCVKAREICCLSYDELMDFIDRRKKEIRKQENQYTILVTALSGKSMRAYINAPGVKKTILGKAKVVERKRFPDVLFG